MICFWHSFRSRRRTSTGEVSLSFRSHVACVSKTQSKLKHIFCPVLRFRIKRRLCFILPLLACLSNGSSCSMGTHTLTLERHHQAPLMLYPLRAWAFPTRRPCDRAALCFFVIHSRQAHLDAIALFIFRLHHQVVLTLQLFFTRMRHTGCGVFQGRLGGLVAGHLEQHQRRIGRTTRPASLSLF